MWPRADAGRRGPEPPAPGCRRGWSAPRTAQRGPAGLCLLRRRRRPAPGPPRHRLDRWLHAPEAAGGGAERQTRQHPPCQTAASRSVRPRRDAPGRGRSRPRGRRGGPGRGRARRRGGAGPGAGRTGGAARPGRSAGPERAAACGPAGSEVPRGARRLGYPQSSRFPCPLGSPNLTTGPTLQSHRVEGDVQLRLGGETVSTLLPERVSPSFSLHYLGAYTNL